MIGGMGLLNDCPQVSKSLGHTELMSIVRIGLSMNRSSSGEVTVTRF